MKEPSLVPVPVMRSQTVSSSTVDVLDLEFGSRRTRGAASAITAFTPSAPGAWFGPNSLVLDQIVGDQLVGDVEVPLVEPFLDQAADEFFGV